MNAYQIGFLYEIKAARYIRARGYRILARRFRAGDGEIDIVALDGDTVVFAEVKARPDSRLDSGIAAVDADKRRRLEHAAGAFLRSRGWTDRPCRFDIVEFTRAGVQYLENAF